MAKIQSFEDLDVWQKGKDLTVRVYEMTGSFPRDEAFGLTSQIKRAALSVPANIAEGFGRYHFLDKTKFYLNARGSLYELKSHFLVAKELGITADLALNDLFVLIDDLSCSLNKFINTTRNLKSHF